MPDEDPSPSWRWNIVKKIAIWAADKIGVLAGEDVSGGGLIGLLFDTAQIASWVWQYLPYIQAYSDRPKSLQDLQNAASAPQKGYEVHHIVVPT